MNHRLSIIISVVLLALTTWASTPLSPHSRLTLLTQGAKDGARRAVAAQVPIASYQAFIAIDDAETINKLQALGVTVNAIFDGYVTAQIPVEALPELVVMRGVNNISLAQRVHLCNDSLRKYSFVDAVHNAEGFVTPYTGKGVLVGMIDTGIDFNHINFCDSTGATRVCAVYMPCDTTGASPIVGGSKLPGSCYEDAAQIAALTTDSYEATHGTHTTGTAAGGYMSNGWHGVATEANIVACGMPEDQFTDVNIANCVNYIFDYAERMGKPCVVNMSIGSYDGAHDGTSFLCRTFDAVSGPGRICVLSAGNDGDTYGCFHADLAQGDTVTTLLRNYWGGLQRVGYVSMWSDAKQVHNTRAVIINRSTGELEYASPLLSLDENTIDSVYVLSNETDSAFAAYYDGYMWSAGGIEDNGRYHSYWVYNATSLESGHLLGLQYVADSAATALSGWSTKYTYFYTFNLDGITGGSASGTISDLATGDSTISVGAYCTRNTVPLADGGTYTLSTSHPVDIAYFSSYGPDERGMMRPDVCAPGCMVVSSASRYDTAATNRQYWQPSAFVNGAEYPYCPDLGTSMSTPAVAGAVALWLQLNPALGPSDVREVLKQTSYRDVLVDGGNADRWGYGKLDVAAGTRYVIDHMMLTGDVNKDGEVSITDVSVLIDILLANENANFDAATLTHADVNRDNEISISDVTALINIILELEND